MLLPVHSKCLIIVPHQDDEMLGCCALIQRNPESKFDVFIVVADSGPSKKYPYLAGNDLYVVRLSESRIAAKHFKNVNYPIGGGLFRVDNKHIDEKIMGTHINGCSIDFPNYDYIFTTHPNDKHHEHKTLGKIIKNICTYHKNLYFFFVDKTEAEKSKKCEMEFINKKISIELNREELEFKKNIMDIFQTQIHFLYNLVRREDYWYERFYNV